VSGKSNCHASHQQLLDSWSQNTSLALKLHSIMMLAQVVLTWCSNTSTVT
jgi:hypothetical protein